MPRTISEMRDLALAEPPRGVNEMRERLRMSQEVITQLLDERVLDKQDSIRWMDLLSFAVTREMDDAASAEDRAAATRMFNQITWDRRKKEEEISELRFGRGRAA